MSGAENQGGQAPADLANMSDEQVEHFARHLGWKPMEEGFKGKPENFKGPRDYVDMANRNPAIMWQNLRTIEKRYGTLERDSADTRAKLDQAVDLISDMNTQFRSVSQRAYDKARADLLAERDAAVDSGDRPAFTKADTALAELEKNKPAVPKAPVTPATPPEPKPAAEVVEWGQRNPWFYSDIALQSEANALHVSLLNTRKDLTLAENLALVEQKIKILHPDKFPKARVTPPPEQDEEEEVIAPTAGERGNSTPRTPPRQNKRDFASLPKDSKQAFTRYKDLLARKEGSKPLTEAEWASNYYEQFPEE